MIVNSVVMVFVFVMYSYWTVCFWCCLVWFI